MSYRKYILIVLLILVSLFVFHFKNKQSKFEIIYKQREDVSLYNELYTDGTLRIIQNFSIDIIDHHEEVITTSTHKILHLKLRDIKKYTNDLEVLNTGHKLLENEFYVIDISKNLKSGYIKIFTKKKYLMRDNTPTYHCLVYDDRERNLAYRFKENDNWYAFSIDSPEDAKERFLDFTPEWLIPYLEAQDFFKRQK
jgi:hypothetical protein